MCKKLGIFDESNNGSDFPPADEAAWKKLKQNYLKCFCFALISLSTIAAIKDKAVKLKHNIFVRAVESVKYENLIA